MLDACVYWAVSTVSWTLSRAFEEDMQWGLVSHRQRHVFRMETIARMSNEVGALPAIGRVAGSLAATLRERWSVQDLEIPVYRAFDIAE
jgi:hypothetical protein